MAGSPLRELIWIFCAGGIGCCARVLAAGTLDRWAAHAWGTRFAFVGTLVVNLLGCFAIGLLSATLARNPLRPIILGGLLGGFTTFSAFGLLSWELAKQGRWLNFMGQVLGHVVGGLLCAGLGLALAQALVRPR